MRRGIFQWEFCVTVNLDLLQIYHFLNSLWTSNSMNTTAIQWELLSPHCVIFLPHLKRLSLSLTVLHKYFAACISDVRPLRWFAVRMFFSIRLSNEESSAANDKWPCSLMESMRYQSCGGDLRVQIGTIHVPTGLNSIRAKIIGISQTADCPASQQP